MPESQPLVNGEARQAVAVLTQRMNDCQQQAGFRWESHERAHTCLAQQLADVERGVTAINLTLASGGAELRKAELDRSSKIWVAVAGSVVVLINAGLQVLLTLIE